MRSIVGLVVVAVALTLGSAADLMSAQDATLVSQDRANIGAVQGASRTFSSANMRFDQIIALVALVVEYRDVALAEAAFEQTRHNVLNCPDDDGGDWIEVSAPAVGDESVAFATTIGDEGELQGTYKILLLRHGRFVYDFAGVAFVADPMDDLVLIANRLLAENRSVPQDRPTTIRTGGIWDRLPTLNDVPAGLAFQEDRGGGPPPEEPTCEGTPIASPDAETTSIPDDEERTPTPDDAPTATPENELIGTPNAAVMSERSEGIDGNTYISPTYGYSIEWDEDLWAPDYVLVREADRDVLVLGRLLSGSSGHRFGDLVYFEAYDAFDGDPEDCLAASSVETPWGESAFGTPTVYDVEPYKDENGDVVAGVEDGVAFAAYTIYYGGKYPPFDPPVAYYECRTLVAGEAVLVVSMKTQNPDFEEVRAELDDVLSTLDRSDVSATTEGGRETAILAPEEDETATP